MRSSLPLGKICNGLYYTLDNIPPSLDTAAFSSLPLAGFVTSQSSLKLAKTWHIRLGHAPLSKIKLLYPEINVVMLNNIFVPFVQFARQHRLSFDTSSTKTTFPFKLSHTDTWGPYSHPTHNGCTLFLSIVDDYTRVTWIYRLKNKNNCVVVLEQFFT